MLWIETHNGLNMHKIAADLFRQLLDDAEDVTQLPNFKTYSGMTTNHAQQVIIRSLKPNRLYRNADRLMIRLGDQLCHITINKPHCLPNLGCWHPMSLSFEPEPPPPTVRITLPFSPKWIFGNVKCRDIRRIVDYYFFARLMRKLTKKIS